MDLRADDGFFVPQAYIPPPGIGFWQPTPPAFAPAATPEWATMRPFAMISAEQFRPDAPPPLGGVVTPVITKRCGWSAHSTAPANARPDGRGSLLGAADPARLRPDRARGARVHPLGVWEQARLFALLNMANSDANISTWDAKYTFRFLAPGHRDQERRR